MYKLHSFSGMVKTVFLSVDFRLVLPLAAVFESFGWLGQAI